MNAGLELRWRDDRLSCRVHGCTRLDTLARYLDEVADLSRRRPARAVLVDLTETDDVVGAGDRLLLGFRLARDWPPAVPMAVLVLPEMLVPDRTFEHVACHRGLRVRSFCDRTAAWRWLALEAPAHRCRPPRLHPAPGTRR